MTVFFSWIAPISVWKNNKFSNCNLHLFFVAFINLVFPIVMLLLIPIIMVSNSHPPSFPQYILLIVGFGPGFGLILLIQDMGNYSNLYKLSKCGCQLFGKPLVHRSLIFDFLQKPFEPKPSFPDFFVDFLKDKDNVMKFKILL